MSWCVTCMAKVHASCKNVCTVCCRPDGRTLFRNAVLERQGWHVLTVPWFEWQQLVTKNMQFGYLRDKINRIADRHRRSITANADAAVYASQSGIHQER